MEGKYSLKDFGIQEKVCTSFFTC